MVVLFAQQRLDRVGQAGIVRVPEIAPLAARALSTTLEARPQLTA
jgi:hypothetical protein